MGSISKYEPCLTYKKEFNEDEGTFIKLRTSSEKTNVRQFEGESVEELLFTYESFRTKCHDISIPDAMLCHKFATCLNFHSRKEWDKTIDDMDPVLLQTVNGFRYAFLRFVKIYAPDPYARRTATSGFYKGRFNKPKDQSIKAHLRRIKELVRYINLLPGGTDTLDKEATKNLFFSTHPAEWQSLFLDSARDIEDSTIEQVRQFMERRKEVTDRKQKKNKDNKRKPDDVEGKSSRKKGKTKGNRKKGGKPTSGPDSQCRLHPHAKHTWRMCYKNPKGDAYQGQGGGRGNDRGRGSYHNEQYWNHGALPPPPQPAGYIARISRYQNHGCEISLASMSSLSTPLSMTRSTGAFSSLASD